MFQRKLKKVLAVSILVSLCWTVQGCAALASILATIGTICTGLGQALGSSPSGTNQAQGVAQAPAAQAQLALPQVAQPAVTQPLAVGGAAAPAATATGGASIAQVQRLNADLALLRARVDSAVAAGAVGNRSTDKGKTVLLDAGTTVTKDVMTAKAMVEDEDGWR